MKERYKRIIDEQYFPYYDMSYEERNYYLNIIRHCQDISCTIYKVDGISKCDLITMVLKKHDNVVYMNGAVQIGNENRYIDGVINIDSDNIYVNMSVTRLCVKDKNKEYKVEDKFYIEDGKLIRQSRYNNDAKYNYVNILDDEMKGRLR